MTAARQMLPAPAAVQMFDHQNLFKTDLITDSSECCLKSGLFCGQTGGTQPQL